MHADYNTGLILRMRFSIREFFPAILNFIFQFGEDEGGEVKETVLASVNLVPYGTCYTKIGGTELGGVQLQRSS